MQTKHNENFYKCTLNKKYVPTIEVPFFYKLNLKKVNENSAKHYIFKKVINQQDFFFDEKPIIRVSSTGFLEIDLVPKLKIDEFWYDLWNSVKKIQCLLYKNKI